MTVLSRIGACLLIAALSTVAHALPGSPVQCTIGNPCDVKITPQEFFDVNNRVVACTAQVGEITINGGAHPTPGRKTVIHWTIGPPATHVPPTNAVYTFETRGLIVFRDNDNATLKKADSVTDTDLLMTHRFKALSAVVIYYPLVFQTIGSNPPVLCGSSDPKIVNQ